jgi:ribosomal protein S12 methylthiotransferase
MVSRTLKDFHTERLSTGTRVSVVNLGCVRNTVDSQNTIGRLERKGHRVVVPEKADVVIVNTCSFIEDAKKESVDAILDLIELKKQGKIKKIIVAGCLAQRYGAELLKELPEVDAFVGVQALKQEGLQEGTLLTPPHYAYVKICESCFNQCSFCVIPRLKGKFVSRQKESILEDVRRLDDRGVRELNVIGQDITAYGMDLYREKRLAELLRGIARECRNIEWIRLLYAYPAHVTDELLDAIAAEPRICKYIDIPLQHVNDRILKAMNRSMTKAQIIKLVQRIRRKVPGAFLRTTFIVGFPGETAAEFRELLDFIQQHSFERVGVFMYSHEEGTAAYNLDGQVPERSKRERQGLLVKNQQEISRKFQEKLISHEIKVLIEERAKDRKDMYLGRSEFDAPDVDGEVRVHSGRKLRQGDFVRVRITGATEYDLEGEAV